MSIYQLIFEEGKKQQKGWFHSYLHLFARLQIKLN
jgi:hypothetical protein